MMTIQLTESQNEVVERALAAVRNGDDFSVTGLAGTGKTVVLAFLTQRLVEEGFAPQVCAPTGKAAQNVTKKFPQLAARTLHSALSQSVHDRIKEFYQIMADLDRRKTVWTEWAASDRTTAEPPWTLSDADALALIPVTVKKLREEVMERLKFTAKQGELPFKSLVFDEASMIGTSIYRDLIAPIQCPKVYFGDHGQLPPVNDDPAIDLANADAKLTQIHRQAAGSNILKIAYAVNKGLRIDATEFADASDVTFVHSEAYKDVIPYADTHQVLVWKNDDRHALNVLLRKRLLGIESSPDRADWIPVIGERLMMDQNIKYHGLMNGEEVEVVDMPKEVEGVPKSKNPYIETIAIRRLGDPIINTKVLNINLGNLMPKDHKLDVDNERYNREMAMENGVKTIWTYAITCHKAQGSEYPKVCIFRPSPIPADKAKWMYTACTRAQSELVIISNDYRPARSMTFNGMKASERLAQRRKSA